jgi:hypothetical protein
MHISHIPFPYKYSSKESPHHCTQDSSSNSTCSTTQSTDSSPSSPFPLLILITPCKSKHIRHIQNQRDDSSIMFTRDIPTIVSQKNWNLRTATRARRSHKTGTAYNPSQNTFESVALICRCGFVRLIRGRVRLQIQIPRLIRRLDRFRSTSVVQLVSDLIRF